MEAPNQCCRLDGIGGRVQGTPRHAAAAAGRHLQHERLQLIGAAEEGTPGRPGPQGDAARE